MIAREKELMQRLLSVIINPEQYEIGEGVNNNFTVKCTNNGSSFYINSKYNPFKQAADFAEKNVSKNGTIFLYGLGLGYHVQEIIKRMEAHQTLHVFECNLPLVKIAFERLGADKLFKNENINLYAYDDMKACLNDMKMVLESEDISVCIYDPSVRAIPQTMHKLEDILMGFKIRVNSVERFGHMLAENRDYNLQKNYPDAGKLYKNKLIDVPCIIVSAGPSLENDIETLKIAKEHALIFAVGRTAKYLEDHGVMADFYFESDSQSFIHHHFLTLKNTSVPLIMLTTADRNLYQYEGKKLLISAESSKNNIGGEYEIEVGGSVATLAISSANLFGCCPIILIGQDLCYTGEQMHAGGEKKGFITTAATKYVEGIDAKQYPTQQNLYLYLRWIENYISRKSISVINCTSKGARIHGCKHMNLEKWLCTAKKLDTKKRDIIQSPHYYL